MTTEREVLEKLAVVSTATMPKDRELKVWENIQASISQMPPVLPRRHRRTRIAGSAAAAAAVVLLAGGLYGIFHRNTDMPALTKHPSTASTPRQAWNSLYWSSQNPAYLGPQLMGATNRYLVARVIGGNLPGGEKTEKIYLTPQTTLWQDGKMVLFSSSQGALAKGDFFSVIVKQQDHHLAAEQIYGPDSQYYGVVQRVNGNRVTVREVSQANYKDYTGRTLTLQFDRRTNFNGASPSDLKPGHLLQAQTAGRYPGIMLMYGAQISVGKKLPNGVTQWVQVNDKRG